MACRACILTEMSACFSLWNGMLISVIGHLGRARQQISSIACRQVRRRDLPELFWEARRYALNRRRTQRQKQTRRERLTELRWVGMWVCHMWSWRHSLFDIS